MSKRRKKNSHRRAKSSLTELYAAAEQALKAGKRNLAAERLREIIAQSPQESKAHFLLGNLYNQAGKLDQALQLYDQALLCQRDNIAVQLNRANAFQKLNRLAEAESAYIEILHAKPDLAIAHFNLGLLENRLGKQESAARSFQQAIRIDPQFEAAHQHMAAVLSKLGRLQEAAAAYGGLLRISPQNGKAMQSLGDVLENSGAYLQAENTYRAAIKLNHTNAEIHYSLGSVLQQQGKFDQAITAYEAALEIEPDKHPVRVSLGNCLHQIGEIEKALAQYRDALSCDPNFAHAQFGNCISQLPVVYRSNEELETCRIAYTQALDGIYEHFSNSSIEQRSRAAGAVGFLQPFYLAYQGLSVKTLQKKYAATIRMLMTARYPEFDQIVPMPPLSGKIRLGIVSGFLWNHSAWNYFQGMFEAIDRNRFEIILFATRNKPDRETRLVKSLSDGFIEGPKETAEWAKVIREQDLHALFYPEFGMDPMSIQLGCLRLAPVQLTSWGHPITSGLESIDYYLSSDLMEPSNAQDEYTEQLVRLPNLMMHYRLPTVDPEPIQRSDLGIPEDGPMFWCCQSLFKYLPRHDDVFPRIARELDSACFVFLAGHGGIVEQRVKDRLAAAFMREGLDANRYCCFLDRLPKPIFAAVTAMADVFLDSIGWSGCNSAMEAIAADRPLLTLAGDHMRGRHTSAFLQLMGMKEWIASDKDKYIEMAVLLGRDGDLRRTISDQIRKRKHLLYRDPKPVRALETFLTQTVEQYEPKASPIEETTGILRHLQQRVDEHPLDGTVHLELARHLQHKGDFDAAAMVFSRSVELQNPLYAQAERGPAPAPDQPATYENGYRELEGLDYPAIPPVGTGQSRPFWSVVIPAYNRENYLLECLASVLAQWKGDEHMEIIVIDNGSERWLKSRVESIGRGIVRYHRHPETIPLQCKLEFRSQCQSRVLGAPAP